MRRYAVIGSPIEHSRSPEIYLPLFRKYGMEASFSRIRVEAGELAGAMPLLRRLDGFAVTMPHKRAVMPFLDSVDPSALTCGAVNIVSRSGEELIGHNTDGPGLVDALSADGITLTSARVLILGRGGAALSAARALESAGADPSFLVRTLSPEPPYPELLISRAASAGPCSLFINASPVGMAGEAFPYRGLLEALHPSAVYDMVYRREEPTPLVRLSESLGIPARDGSRMLLYQALRAFYIWTGVRAGPADSAS